MAKSRIRRVLLWVGIVLGTLLVCSVFAIFLLLKTDFGKRQLRQIVLNEVNASFEEGGIDFASIEGDLFSRFVINDLVVIDNGDGPMVRANRIEAEIDFDLLWEKRVRLVNVVIDRVDASVVYDDTGTRYPIPKPTDTLTTDAVDAVPWIIEIEELVTRQVHFDFGRVDELAAFSAKEGFLRAGLLIDEEAIKIFVKEASFLPTGLSTGATARAKLRYLDDRFVIDWAVAKLGASRLFTKGEIREFDDVYIDLEILPGYVSAPAIRRALPDLPMLTSLVVEGSLKGHMNALAVDLNVESPGNGNARITYIMNLNDPMTTWSLALAGEKLNIPGWTGGQYPHTDLALSLGVIGTGFGDGDFERIGVDAKGAVRGYPSFTLGGSASYRKGIFRLDNLQLAHENAISTMFGLYDITLEEGGFQATVSIPQLAALPLPVQNLRGSVFGDAWVHLGKEENIAKLDLNAKEIRFEDYTAQSVSFEGELSFTDQIKTGTGSLLAQTINLAGANLSLVQAQTTIDPEQTDTFFFDVYGKMQSEEWARIKGKLIQTEPETILDIESGSLAFNKGETLSISQEGKVAIGSEEVSWKNIKLNNAKQNIFWTDGTYLLAEEKISGKVHTKQLPLQAVLGTLLPAQTNIDGLLSLDLTLNGKVLAPKFRVDAKLEKAQLASLTNLHIKQFFAEYNGRQLSTDLEVMQGQKTLIKSKGQVPVQLYQGEFHKGILEYTFSLNNLAFESLQSILPDSLQELKGNASVNVVASGTGSEPKIEASAELSDIFYQDWENVDVSGTTLIGVDDTEGKLSVSLGKLSLIKIDAWIDLSWKQLLDISTVPEEILFATPIEFRANLNKVSVEELKEELPKSYQEQIPLSEGLIESEVFFVGTLGNPEIEFSGGLQKGVTLFGTELVSALTLDWKAQFLEGEVDLLGNFSAPGVENVAYELRLPIGTLGFVEILDGKYLEVDTLLDTPLQSSITIKNLDPHKLPWNALGGKPSDLHTIEQGVFGANILLEGTLNTPHIDYILAIEDLVIVDSIADEDGLGPLFAVLEGSYDTEALSSTLSISDRNFSSLLGDMTLQLPIADAIAIAKGELDASKLSPYFQLSLQSEGIELALINDLFLGTRDAGGTFALNATVEGPLQLAWPSLPPPAQLDIWSGPLRLGKSELNESRIFLRFDEGVAVWEVSAQGKSGGKIETSGDISIDLQQDSFVSEQTPLSAYLFADSFDLGFAVFLVPGVRHLGGRLSTEGITLSGTVGTPSLEGNLLLSDGEAVIEGYDSYFRDITVKSSFSSDRILIDEFVIYAGRGSAFLSGEIKVDNAWLSEFSLHVVTTDFEIPYGGTTLATLDTEVSLSGKFEEKELRGEINVVRGTLTLPERLTTGEKNLMPLDSLQDVVLVAGGEPIQKETEDNASSKEKEPFFYSFSIDIPDRFYVKGSPFEGGYVDIELGGDLRMEDQGSGLALVGAIKIISGGVSLLDSQFEFSKDSRLTFIGTDLDPRLSIEASSSVQVSKGDSFETYTVSVNVTGTASEPQVSISSDPPLEEARIAQLLLTGTLDNADGAGGFDAEQATQEVGQKLGALLGVHLVPFLNKGVIGTITKNFDVLRIDPEKFELGKYFYLDKKHKKKCYIGLSHRFTAPAANALGDGPNQTETNFLCQVGGNWGINGSYGAPKDGTSAAGLDILWSKDY